MEIWQFITQNWRELITLFGEHYYDSAIHRTIRYHDSSDGYKLLQATYGFEFPDRQIRKMAPGLL